MFEPLALLLLPLQVDQQGREQQLEFIDLVMQAVEGVVQVSEVTHDIYRRLTSATKPEVLKRAFR